MSWGADLNVSSITKWSASKWLASEPNMKDRRRSAVYPESQRRRGSPEEAWCILEEGWDLLASEERLGSFCWSVWTVDTSSPENLSDSSASSSFQSSSHSQLQRQGAWLVDLSGRHSSWALESLNQDRGSHPYRSIAPLISLNREKGSHPCGSQPTASHVADLECMNW